MTRFRFQGTGETIGGSPVPVLLVIGAVLLLGSGGAVAAVSEALIGALIAVAVVTVLAAAGLAVFLVRHARREIPSPQGFVRTLPVRTARELPGAERPAIERDLHLHFHGVDAADVAEIIRQQKPE